MGLMTLRKFTVLGFVFLLTMAASAQHFPLKQGEWEMTSTPTTPGQPPMTLLFCFSDAEWVKGLSQNPSCTIQNLSVTSADMSYNVDCPLRTMQMKGTVRLIFDGMTHMTGKSSLDFTVNGKTTHTNPQTEYHWKQAECSPNDMNLRPHPAH
jgi:hypothetical protein